MRDIGTRDMITHRGNETDNGSIGDARQHDCSTVSQNAIMGDGRGWIGPPNEKAALQVLTGYTGKRVRINNHPEDLSSSSKTIAESYRLFAYIFLASANFDVHN